MWNNQHALTENRFIEKSLNFQQRKEESTCRLKQNWEPGSVSKQQHLKALRLKRLAACLKKKKEVGLLSLPRPNRSRSLSPDKKKRSQSQHWGISKTLFPSEEDKTHSCGHGDGVLRKLMSLFHHSGRKVADDAHLVHVSCAVNLPGNGKQHGLYMNCGCIIFHPVWTQPLAWSSIESKDVQCVLE